MRLPPLLALRIPHLDRAETCSSHAQVASIENIASFIVHVFGTVAESKDLENLKVTGQVHGDKLSTALLVRGSDGAEYRAPGLARLIPGRNRPLCNRANRGVGIVKVEDARGGLLEKLAAAVAYDVSVMHSSWRRRQFRVLTSQLMEANLDFKSRLAVFDNNGKICLFDEGNLLIGVRGTQDIAERHVLETFILTDVVKVGNVDTRRDAGAVESKDFQGGKVWCQELVLFKIGTPRQ